ncbi:MAG TPA: prolyl oligopeptidase family serine peptidase [Candidatus Baltobacteraceae bacterium]
MTMRASLLAALFACAAAPALAAAQFSMDDILSAPFVDNLTPSADGVALAFTAHERGAHNVFIRNGAHARRLTAYTRDDGQEISDLSVVPGDSAVMYVRGGDANRHDEYPNPTTLADPPLQQIWVVPVRGGAPVLVGQGHSPAVSPNGNRVVWILRGQPMNATLRAGSRTLRVGKATSLFAIRGRLSDPRWSPDGSRIAFSNERGNHGFIAIFDVGRKTLVFPTPNFAYDAYPVWSPDSSRIAFVRAPGLREDASAYDDPQRDAPWTLWVADAATGTAHRIFSADPGMGSVYYETDSASQLFWSKDGYIAFPWEKDGWRHLYSVRAEGGAPRRLTPGDGETETVNESRDGRHLLYQTNIADIDRRHIWSVAFDGGPPSQLTKGPHSQWAPRSLANGAIAFIDADYRHPTAVQIRSARGDVAALDGPAVPASFPADAVVEPKLVTFKSLDGLLLHGQLFVPASDTGRHCAVIFDHGGSERQMLPGFHYMEAYTNLYESNQYYANRGCLVLSINYRSGIMYGHDFREAKDYGYRGASEYQDVLAGAKFLQARGDVDPGRLGIYGLSYGGYLTALGLARNSDVFKAGVDMAGVHNWATLLDNDYGSKQGTPAQRAVAYAASPVASIDTWRSPVFLSQGDDDRNVAFSQGVDLATRLQAKGVEVRQLVFPDETHENLVYAHMLALYELSANWLLGKLNAR